MPECPYCQHPTDEDFGLVECSQCGKSFMADDPVAAEPVDPSDAADAADAGDSADAEDSAASGDRFEIDEGASAGDAAGAGDSEASDGRLQVDDDASVDDAAGAGDSEASDGRIQTDALATESQNLHESGDAGEAELSGGRIQTDAGHSVAPVSGPRPPESSASPASPDSLDITVSAKALQLVLEGFDTSDKVDVLLDVLSDERMAMDAKAWIKKIKKGRVLIGPVTALQASLLVQSLSHLPVKIDWQEVSK